MKDGNKFLYEGNYILLGLLVIALVCSSLSFFLPINLTSDKSAAYWSIMNGVSSSLYDDTNPDLDGIFTYYLRSEKKDSPSFDDYGEGYYEDYSLIKFDEDQVSIRTFDGLIVKFYKASTDKDIFLKETTYDEDNIITKEVPVEEFYYYNPLYKDQEAYKLRYLTNDNVFLRTYGSDFKFDPLTMDFKDAYVYVVGTYDGKTAKILKTNGRKDDKATRALSYLEDAVERTYKDINRANKIKDLNIDDKEFDKVEAIICSMTPQEKRNTKLLNGSRRMRIAKGSGTTVQDVNKFMKSFEMTQKMMKQMKSNKGGMKKMMKNIENMNPNDLKNFKF